MINLKKEAGKKELRSHKQRLIAELTQLRMENSRLETIIEEIILNPEGKLALSIKDQVLARKAKLNV